jgi:hypothetical protein
MNSKEQRTATTALLRIKQPLFLKQSDLLATFISFFASPPKTLSEWGEQHELCEVLDVTTHPPLPTENVARVPFKITPDTLLTLYSENIRLVFLLDMQSSMTSVGRNHQSKVNLSLGFET